MQYAAGKNNFYALMACIFNEKLTSNDALSLFNIPLGTELRSKNVKKTNIVTRVAKTIDVYAVRCDYEKGMNSQLLAIKYKITKSRVSECIRQAGGTMRPRGKSIKNGGLN